MSTSVFFKQLCDTTQIWLDEHWTHKVLLVFTVEKTQLLSAADKNIRQLLLLHSRVQGRTPELELIKNPGREVTEEFLWEEDPR